MRLKQPQAKDDMWSDSVCEKRPDKGKRVTDESELLRAEGGVRTKDDNKFQQLCLIFNSAGRDASMEKAERADMLTWDKTEVYEVPGS